VVNEYVGGYDDWIRQRPAPAVADKPAKPAQNKSKPKPARKKLGFNEQKELKALPRKIEKLEQAIEQIQQQMAEADFYKQDAAIISDAQQQLSDYENQLEQLFERWEQLESE